MIFNTLQFLPFIAIVLLVHRLASWSTNRVFLLVVSYLFYASFNPPYALILLLSTLVDYWAGKRIHASEKQSVRRAFLVLSCCTNLGVLAFFKYSNFLVENLQSLLSLGGVVWEGPRMDFVLPVGISFYTFQSLSYTIAIYRRRLEPSSFLDFALFVSFFTQLVAGPIVRARDFIPQLEKKKTPSLRVVNLGLFLIIRGYFKKVVIADNLAGLVGTVFLDPGAQPAELQLLGALSFTGQIYCDFSGYSDIAIGLSLMMGLRLRRNFNLPYLARGFSDFWKRWHISLSEWIRDYLYIPLGGNRGSKARAMFNLVLTMAICGLWHGASWMFVLWGVLHGLYLVAERLYEGMCKSLEARGYGVQAARELVPYKLLSTLVTFVLVVVGWVFFRATSLEDAIEILQSAARIQSFSFAREEWLYLLLLFVVHAVLFLNIHVLKIRRVHWMWYSLLAGVMTFMVITGWESNNVFIYFQF